MKTVMQVKQRGISLNGMIFLAISIVIVGILLLKIIPAYMENAQIKHAMDTIANNPEMQQAEPNKISNSFDNIASIEGINMIKGEDIEISNDNGKLLLSAKYSVKVSLGGNLSLLIEFSPTSAP